MNCVSTSGYEAWCFRAVRRNLCAMLISKFTWPVRAVLLGGGGLRATPSKIPLFFRGSLRLKLQERSTCRWLSPSCTQSHFRVNVRAVGCPYLESPTYFESITKATGTRQSPQASYSTVEIEVPEESSFTMCV